MQTWEEDSIVIKGLEITNMARQRIERLRKRMSKKISGLIKANFVYGENALTNYLLILINLKLYLEVPQKSLQGIDLKNVDQANIFITKDIYLRNFFRNFSY